MPRPKKVEIDGVELKEVQNVNISINTPVGQRGDYEGRTTAATVRIMRRARNTPTMSLFQNGTNEDGRLKIISAEIVLENSVREETYTAKLEECFIAEWSFTQPEDDDFLFETLTLSVGKMSLSGGGGTKNFAMPEFKRNTL